MAGEDKLDLTNWKKGNFKFRSAPEGSPFWHGYDTVKEEAKKRGLSPNEFSELYEYSYQSDFRPDGYYLKNQSVLDKSLEPVRRTYASQSKVDPRKSIISRDEVDEKYYEKDGGYVPRLGADIPEDPLMHGMRNFSDTVESPEFQGMSYRDPEEQRDELVRQLKKKQQEIDTFDRVRRKDKSYRWTQPSWAYSEAKRARGERSSIEEGLEDIEEYVRVDADEKAQDPTIEEYGLTVESEGYPSKDVSAPSGRGSKKKKVATPSKLTADPSVILEESREMGVPWQDIIINEYISKNPWLDQHKVREAVYGVADRHFDKWMRDNKGNPAGYNNQLRQDLSRGKRGGSTGRGSYKGKGKKKGGNLATSILKGNQKLKRYIDILQEAQGQADRIYDQEIAAYHKNVGVNKDNEIDTSDSYDKAFGDAFAKKDAVADAHVNQAMRQIERGPDGKAVKEEDKLNYNRWGVQRDVQIMIADELLKRYKGGDKETIELVDRFKSGKKAGKPAFESAANDIFLRYNVDDVRTTPGNRNSHKIKKSKKGYDRDKKWGH